ncbi:MAG: TolB family protein [Saprospiraceae bacterium]
MNNPTLFTIGIINLFFSLSLIAQTPAFPMLRGKYFGQRVPGMSAELFAPGIITTDANEHSAPAFSSDGKVVLWAVMDRNYKGHFYEMKSIKGVWSKPASPAFVDTTADHYYPAFSPDGKTLYFSSRRSAPAGYPEGKGNRIWSTAKTDEGWAAPIPFDTSVSKAQEFSHSISKKGTLYFSAVSSDGANMDIYKAEKTANGYAKPVPLPHGINSAGYEDGPYISPNEDFLIFESTRPAGIDGSHDLYIVFQDKKGHWGTPINMGPKVNSAGMERFPRLSPDGKYLFFGSNRDQSNGKVGFDIYWIDAKIIKALKQMALKN